MTASTGTPTLISATLGRPLRRARPETGPVCPGAPEHGELLALQGAERPHLGHAGRPKTHPLGAATPSRSFFGRDDLLAVLDPGSDLPDAIAAAG